MLSVLINMLKLLNIRKSFSGKEVLKNINLNLPNCGLFFIKGVSGAGKTTLFNIIAKLDQPTSGLLKVDEKVVNKLNMANYLNLTCGIIFQNHYFVPYLSIIDNIRLVSGNNHEIINKFFKLLRKMNLDYTTNQYSYQLSGGELQRVSVARTIAFDHKILLADEPTGSLDRTNAEIIFKLLADQAKTKLVIVVTHNDDLVNKKIAKIIELKQGTINYNVPSSINSSSMTLNRRSIKFSNIIIATLASLKKRLKMFIISTIVIGIIVSLILFALSLTLGLNLFIEQQTKYRLDGNYLRLQQYNNYEQIILNQDLLKIINEEANISFDLEPFINELFYQVFNLSNDEIYEVKLVDTVKTVAVNSLFAESFKNSHLILQGKAKIPYINKSRSYEEIDLKLEFKNLVVVNETNLYNIPKIYINQDYIIKLLVDFKLPLIAKDIGLQTLSVSDYLLEYNDFLGYKSSRIAYQDYESRVKDYDLILAMPNSYRFFDNINQPSYTLVIANDEMLLKTFKELLDNGVIILLAILFTFMTSVLTIINLLLKVSIKKRKIELLLLKVFGASGLELVLTIIAELFIILTVATSIAATLFYSVKGLISWQVNSRSLIGYNYLPITSNIVLLTSAIVLITVFIASLDSILLCFKIDIAKELKND
jgi:ABC-type lipoprotein export system ATPase subunit